MQLMIITKNFIVFFFLNQIIEKKLRRTQNVLEAVIHIFYVCIS